jgi:hypothetical protein
MSLRLRSENNFEKLGRLLIFHTSYSERIADARENFQAAEAARQQRKKARLAIQQKRLADGTTVDADAASSSEDERLPSSLSLSLSE